MALGVGEIPLTAEPGFYKGMETGNALKQENLNNAILGVKAKYAPWTEYADAESKMAYANLLPYQIQAQVLSNPMLYYAYKDNPAVLQNMMNSLVKSIPQGSNAFGDMQMPIPRQQNALGNGLLSMAINKIMGSSPAPSPMDNMSAQPDQVSQISSPQNNALSQDSPIGQSAGNPLLPGAQGGMGGYIAKMTAPGTLSPYPAGSLIPDPNNPGGAISVPTGKMATSLQTSINAAQRVMPQLNRISEEAAPFMTAVGTGKMQLQRLGNYFLDKQGKLPTQYAKFRADLKAAPEALVKSYGLNPTNETIERMADVIEPFHGETGDQYKSRILGTLENIKQEQIALGQQQLGSGIKLPASQDNVAPEKNNMMVSAGARALSKDLQLPKFNSKQEFKAWYHAQPKMVQDAVRLHLSEK